MKHILYILICLGSFLNLQADPPIIEQQPTNKIVECHETGVIDSLSAWYQNNGGTIISPSSGNVTVQGEISFPEVVNIFNESAGSLCGDSQEVGLRFIATNDEGETTLTDMVYFQFTDIARPIILTQASMPLIACDSMARDSFINWIKAHGNAVAEDLCSDVTWTSFIWNDSEGNIGTSSIDNGPYPPFLGACSYFYRVSFIVEDECGNETASAGRFNVVDARAPMMDTLPADITVYCDEIPDPYDVQVTDFCDPNPTISVSDQSSQAADDSSCDFFNYEIQRVYRAQDGCGNETVHTQTIKVIDDLAALIEGETEIDVACNEFSTDSLYAAFEGVCNDFTINYTDTVLVENSCQTLVLRTHYLNDICDNRDTFEQRITVIDKAGPHFVSDVAEYELYCSEIEDPSNSFDRWVEDVLLKEIVDDCNDTHIIAAVPGSYDISNLDSFPGVIPMFSLDSLCNTSSDSILLRQQVDFVLYDSCGNVNVYTKEFRIIDTIAPTISECPGEVVILGESENCRVDVMITLPVVTDECSELFEIGTPPEIKVLLDEEETIIDTIDNELIIRDVPQGTHKLKYLVSDCNGNTTECELDFTIMDEVAPEIVDCPSDTLVTIDTGCEATFNLPQDIMVEDNCSLNQVNTYTLPDTGNSPLLRYSVVDEDTTLLNKGYIFDNLAPVLYNVSPAIVTLNLTAPLGLNFSIFGEDDVLLGEGVTTEDCSSEIFTFEIPGNLLIEWLEDQRIQLALVPENASISPCGDIVEDTDGITSAVINISYSDALITYTVSGATDVATEQSLTNQATVDLNIGENFITYYVEDQADNVDSCTFKVEIRETQSPEAICKNVIIHTIPNIDASYILDPAVVDNGSMDNCGIDTIYLSQNTFDCSDNGQEIEVMFYVADYSGNIDSCISRVRVESMELNPTYSSGICQSDTLKLFANIPEGQDSNNYTFEWTGPNGYMSSEENPFILNASSDNNGIYYLTVTGFGGCSSTGNVQVSSESLATPVITAERDTLCSGENLILTATVYSGEITYRWYEGVSPNGLLVSTTNVPNTVINPTAGTHTYYVIASGATCESNPSSIIEILALEPPVATVNDSFINICEGEDINLGTTASGNDYEYQWTGPNGFMSNLPNPPAITEANLSNGGQYILLINVGGCTSDTAISRVNVFETPATPIITSNDVFCEGSTITFSVNNIGQGDTYYWYLNGVLFTTTTENSLNIDNALPNLQGEWTVQVEEGICLSELSAIKEIVVSNLGEVTATNTGPGCVGDSIQLFATFLNNATYQWTGPDNFTSSIQNPKILAIAGEYTVNVSSSSDCVITASTTVTVNMAPTITALSSNAEECMSSGDTIRFFPTIIPSGNDYTYSWTGPNGFTSDLSDPLLTDLTDDMVGTYTLIVTQGNCDSDEFAVQVDFNLIPDVGDITLSGNGCVGDDITLTTTPIDGYTYVWVTPSGEYSTDTASLTITNAMLSDEGNYSVALVNDECRGSDSETIYVEIGEIPDAPVVIDNSPLCPGDSLKLSIMDNEGFTYRWKVGDDIITEGNNFTLGDITEDILTMISVEVSDGNCSSEFYPIEGLALGNALTTPIIESDFYEFCVDGASDIVICVTEESSVNNATYTLYDSNDQIIVTSDTPCITIDEVSNLNIGFNTLYLGASRGTCISDASENITVLLSQPADFNANILSEDVTICDERSLTFLSERSENEVDIEWSSPDEDLVFSSTDERMSRVSNYKTGENIIVLSYSTGVCLNFSRDTVRVYLLEEVIARDDEYNVDAGEEIDFDMTENDDFDLSSVINITSEPEEGSLIPTDEGYTYIAPDNFDGEVTIIYELCNEECDLCSEATITIYVTGTIEEECIVPSIITPNEDGINDEFIIPCLSNGSFAGSELTIFNEWGTEVYHSEDYQNEWKGTFNDEPLPVGTYFYVLEIADDRKPINGFLIIQR